MKSWRFPLIAATLTCALADDADQVCAKAVEMHRSGNFEAAISQYEGCLSARPGLVEMRSNYGAALAQIGRYRDAVTQYQKALAANSANPQLRYNLVLAYYKQGDLSKAVEMLEPLHTAAPGNMQVTMLLADCRLRLGEPQRVVELLGPLEAEHREDSGFAYLLGTALIRSGDVKRGEGVVDRILRDADSPEAHFLLGSAAFTNKDFPGAVREFGKTAALNPGLPSVWSFYGQSLLYTGDAKGAAEAFRKELAANPNDYEANIKLGAILSVAGQFQDALPFLEHAGLVRPGSAEVRAELAPVYEHLGRKADAARERAELKRLGIVPGPASGGSGLLAAGTVAPDFSLPALNGNARITLADARRSQPVVLVFGSYSCPKFRFGAPALNRLYDRYHTRVQFVLVYIDEAHADGSWQSTVNEREGIALKKAATTGEKQQYATSCARKLKIDYPMAVDGMDRKVETAYKAWPSAVYLIGRDGRIAWSSRLGELDFHPADMQSAIGRIMLKASAPPRQ